MSGILASFSITRSWYQLTAESNGRTARDLRGIQGVRFLSMFGIIMGHVALLFSVLPYSNTDYIEKVRIWFISTLQEAEWVNLIHSLG